MRFLLALLLRLLTSRLGSNAGDIEVELLVARQRPAVYQRSARRPPRAVRDRVFAVLRRDYEGVGVEFREDEPGDYAFYSRVDIDGPDRNGLGAFGNEATPGKDVGNARLERMDLVCDYERAAGTVHPCGGCPSWTWTWTWTTPWLYLAVDHVHVHCSRARSTGPRARLR